MPYRKRSNLSQYTRNAKRMRLIRSQETDEIKEAKRITWRKKQALSRSLESSAQRESRLSIQRARLASVRARRAAASRSFKLKKVIEACLKSDQKNLKVSQTPKTNAADKTFLSSKKVQTGLLKASKTIKKSKTVLLASKFCLLNLPVSDTFTDEEDPLSFPEA